MRDLTARESECCSFFGFAVREAGDGLLLEVTVPPGQVRVLDDGRACRADHSPSWWGVSTGQLAAAAGVNVQTLRYCERRGLLEKPARRARNH